MSLKTEIRANTQQAQAAFKKFADALNEVEKQGKKTGQSFDDFGKTLNEIEKQGKKAGQSFDSFSNLLAQLKKQSNGNFTNLINELEKLGKTSGLTNSQLNEIFKTIDKQSEITKEHLSEIAKNTNTLTDKLAHSAQAINGWIEIGKGIWNNVGKAFIQTADAINTMNARLKLTTTSTAHFEALKKSIEGIARATSSSTDSISNLFINLNQSLSEMGLSQKQALEMAQTLSQALKVGGASAIDAERAITQFSQALSTGKLQGQDFKAMIQAAPSLLKNMADALGVTTGELRAMATAGELTNEKLVEAFAGMKDKIAKEFKEIPPTVESAMTNLQTSIQGVIESINNDLNITGSVAASIDGIGKIISENSGAFKTATEFIKNHGVELAALLASC